jgi:aldose 1-epimerase
MSDARNDAVVLGDQGSALEASFLPAAGMLCSSLRHRGEELLAQNAGAAAYAELGKTMGIPLLYPWANRLAGFSYDVAGRAVAVPHDPSRIALDDNGLPIHGVIGGRQAWELISAPGAGGHELAARLSWSDARPELFEVFPFRHDLTYEARVHDGRLEIAITVHACGQDAVPLAFGFHPYIAPPGPARERWLVELPAMTHLALDAKQIPIGPDRELQAQRFELAEREFDDGFDALALPARFAVTVGARRITLDFTEGYPCAQVFAPLGSRFICFEPMAARANALRSGSGLPLLPAGERFRAVFSLLVEEVPAES